jgi:mRNA-degrading endonuclease RelE of RelBE toxin-antitoxin system
MGHTRQIRVNKAIEELATSFDPRDLGVFKSSMKTFAYELGRGDRLFYDIDYPNHTILLSRVCDHKSVYGMD